MFRCPTEEYLNAWGGRYATSYKYNAGYPTTGAPRALGVGDRFNPDQPNYDERTRRIREDEIAKPGNTMVAGEALPNASTSSDDTHVGFGNYFNLSEYHNGAGNVLFADSHAKTMKPGDLTSEHLDRRF